MTKEKSEKGAGLKRPVTPSAALAVLVGSKPLPRTEIISKLWKYIKDNNLQDTKNKRSINSDEKLLPIFGGKKQITMFEMAKHISANVS